MHCQLVSPPHHLHRIRVFYTRVWLKHYPHDALPPRYQALRLPKTARGHHFILQYRSYRCTPQETVVLDKQTTVMHQQRTLVEVTKIPKEPKTITYSFLYRGYTSNIGLHMKI